MTAPASDGLRIERARAPESAADMWRRRWRSSRIWLALVAVAVLAGLFYTLTNTSEDRRALGPENPRPDGGMAVARVLSEHGVSVVAPENLDAALAALDRPDAGEGSGTTLLLHDPDSILNDRQLERLSAAAGRTVLVDPGFAPLRAFSDSVRPAGLVPDDAPSPVPAACPAPVAAEAPSAAAGGKIYTADSGCFGRTTPGGTAYSVAIDGSTTVLGNTAFLDNGNVLDHGHPALALWTLGAEPTLVWYQPTFSDLQSDAPPASPFELLPEWFGPAAAWLMLFGVVAILWRARRDGPLVAEPLPVVVPAAETAEGRARLYQDSRAVDAAKASLRSASLTRIADHLRLGHGATAAGVVATLAKAGHRTDSQLLRLFHPDAITTEKQLVAWANDLHILEQEIGIP